MFIVGVALDVVVQVLLVTRLFVSVLVELTLGITTHSTAITPADARVIEVSIAPISILSTMGVSILIGIYG